jgi:hypothetical protein
MPKKKSKNNPGQVTDKSKIYYEVIGGNRIDLPISRNLSWRLFGQLHNVLKKDIR